MITRLLAACTIGTARLVTGVRCNWRGCLPEPQPRIYFANHRSHGDFVLIWTVLPRAAAADAAGRGGRLLGSRRSAPLHRRAGVPRRADRPRGRRRGIAIRSRRCGRARRRLVADPVSRRARATRPTSRCCRSRAGSIISPARCPESSWCRCGSRTSTASCRRASSAGAAALHGHVRRAASLGPARRRTPSSSAPARRCWRCAPGDRRDEPRRQQTLALFGGVVACWSSRRCVGFAPAAAVAGDRPSPTIDNLNARIKAWWVMVALIGVAFLSARPA